MRSGYICPKKVSVHFSGPLITLQYFHSISYNYYLIVFCPNLIIPVYWSVTGLSALLRVFSCVLVSTMLLVFALMTSLKSRQVQSSFSHNRDDGLWLFLRISRIYQSEDDFIIFPCYYLKFKVGSRESLASCCTRRRLVVSRSSPL